MHWQSLQPIQLVFFTFGSCLLLATKCLLSICIMHHSLSCRVVALELQTAQGQSVLDVDTAGMYRPVTRETRDAFDSLLAFIREQYDDQPYDVLRGAAEEVLAVLKNEGIKVRNCCTKRGICMLVLGSPGRKAFSKPINADHVLLTTPIIHRPSSFSSLHGRLALAAHASSVCMHIDRPCLAVKHM